MSPTHAGGQSPVGTRTREETDAPTSRVGAAGTGRPHGGGRTTPRATRENREGWGLVGPAMLVLLALTVFPAIYLAYSSLFDFTLLGPTRRFVLLENYATALTDPGLRWSVLVTFFFVAVAVALELVIGMALAVALSRQSRFNNVASTLLLLPLAVTPAVAALLFRQLLNPNFGWIDYYLQWIGITSTPVEWLSNSPTAWAALVGLDVWQWTPFVALILMAGLQGLPREPFEAAAVDGASRWQAFHHLTLPMLRPFIGIAVVLRTIQAFKTFDSFKVLTDGGPGTTTEIMNLAVYRLALQSFRIGAAAAIGILLLIILSAIVPVLLQAFSPEGEAR